MARMEENPYESPKTVEPFEQGEPIEAFDLRLDRWLRYVSRLIAWPLGIFVVVAIVLSIVSFVRARFYPDIPPSRYVP